MIAARKTTIQSAWVGLAPAMKELGFKSRHSLLIEVIKGELAAKVEEASGRVFLSRESIDRYLAKHVVDPTQLTAAL